MGAAGGCEKTVDPPAAATGVFEAGSQSDGDATTAGGEARAAGAAWITVGPNMSTDRRRDWQRGHDLKCRRACGGPEPVSSEKYELLATSSRREKRGEVKLMDTGSQRIAQPALT